MKTVLSGLMPAGVISSRPWAAFVPTPSIGNFMKAIFSPRFAARRFAVCVRHVGAKQRRLGFTIGGCAPIGTILTSLALLVCASAPSRAQTAPATIAGCAVETEVSTGVFPFGGSGFFLLLPANSGSSYTSVDFGDLLDGSGTYTYTASNSDGLITANDLLLGHFTGDFNFSNSAYDLQGIDDGFQNGTFEYFHGVAPGSVAKQTFELTFLAGGGGDATSGPGSIQINGHGSFTENDETGSRTGAYSYSIVNTAAGKILASIGSHSTTVYLVFSDSNDGVFGTTNSAGGWAVGTFYIPDTTPPTNQIVSPAASAQLTNGLITLLDRATDNVGVQNVEFYLNGQDFGSGVPGVSNLWSMNFSLPPGISAVGVVATDTSGNVSSSNTVTLTVLNQQTTPNLITFADHYLDTPENNPNGPVFVSQDSARMNVALNIPGLQNLAASAWSGLDLALSFGDYSFSNVLAAANMLSGTSAAFYDIQSDPNGNPVTVEEFNVSRSGNTLLIALNIGNPIYLYPIEIIADYYFGVGGTNYDELPFSLTLTDGSRNTNYASINCPIFVTATDISAVDSIYQLNAVEAEGAADFIPPTNEITAPAGGLQVTNHASYLLTGRAGDNVMVTNVYYSLNGAPWTSAASTNNWADWSAVLDLVMGSNTVAAYSVDASGNVSATNFGTVVLVLTSLLTVITNGLGTLSADENGAVLQIGESYSVTATPAAGFKFTDWTGGTTPPLGVLTNGATLHFLMESNLVLAANFVETNQPALSFTFPSPGQQLPSALAAVKGGTGDRWGVAGVWCQLNGGIWFQPATTNGWTNWTTTLELQTSTNMVRAYALNFGGIYSATNSLSFVSSNAFKLQLSFGATQALLANGLNVVLHLSPGLNGEIQISSNLVNWTTLTNFTGTNDTLTVRDPQATNFNSRFYRAIIP